MSSSVSAPDIQLPTICVPVIGASATELLRNSAALLAEFPFQELRVDYLPDPVAALAALNAHIQTHPTATFLVTCRTQASGGRFNGTPEAELAILREAARNGAKLVDLSLESTEALPAGSIQQLRHAGARVILSWHDFERTGDLSAVLQRMWPFAPDLCKIVPTAQTLSDTLALLELLSQRRAAGDGEPGIVAIAMGEPGVPSRVLAPRLGSAFTFGAASTAEATAPGQLTARSLRELYRVESIGPHTPVFGVAGDPIRSSLSPAMLNTAFAERGMDAVYLPLLTRDASELFRAAEALPLAGFSVTMPLKQAVLPFLTHVDPLAARIGAVNTVRREPDGSLVGFNTDAAGITAPLEQRLHLRGARVLVLGAGGAARAAVFGCVDRGARVSIHNRTPAAAQALAAQAGVDVLSDLSTAPAFDVLINATPAGMRGNPTPLPLEPEQLRAGLVFDLVYNPLETPLLRLARERGIEVIPGAEMFIHQGARQFELWTGEPAPVEAMRSVVLDALTP